MMKFGRIFLTILFLLISLQLLAVNPLQVNAQTPRPYKIYLPYVRTGISSGAVRTFVDGYGGNVFTAKDAQMSAGWPTRNGGGHTDAQFETRQRFLMEFDLSSIPANARVIDATIYLYHSYPSESGFTPEITVYSISAANKDWIAGNKDIDPASRGENCWNALASDGNGGVLVPWAGSPGLSTPGVDYETNRIGAFTFNPRSPAGTQFAVPLNAARVQGWLGTNNTNYGVIFFTPENGNTGHVAQSNHPTVAYRPKLVVHYTLP